MSSVTEPVSCASAPQAAVPTSSETSSSQSVPTVDRAGSPSAITQKSSATIEHPALVYTSAANANASALIDSDLVTANAETIRSQLAAVSQESLMSIIETSPSVFSVQRPLIPYFFGRPDPLQFSYAAPEDVFYSGPYGKYRDAMQETRPRKRASRTPISTPGYRSMMEDLEAIRAQNPELLQGAHSKQGSYMGRDLFVGEENEDADPQAYQGLEDEYEEDLYYIEDEEDLEDDEDGGAEDMYEEGAVPTPRSVGSSTSRSTSASHTSNQPHTSAGNHHSTHGHTQKATRTTSGSTTPTSTTSKTKSGSGATSQRTSLGGKRTAASATRHSAARATSGHTPHTVTTAAAPHKATHGKATAALTESKSFKTLFEKATQQAAAVPKSAAKEKEEAEERQKVREFWRSLPEQQRNALIKVEKEAILKKMKEQQKHTTCACELCGKRRTAIEEELEMLYDAYYQELERYVGKPGESGAGFDFFNAALPTPTLSKQRSGSGHNGASLSHSSSSSSLSTSTTASTGTHSTPHQSKQPLPHQKIPHIVSPNAAVFASGSQSFLNVADELMKNEGRKFIEMMEELADARLRRERLEDGDYDPQLEYEGDSNYADEEEEEENGEDADDQDMLEEDEESGEYLDGENPDDEASEDMRIEEGKHMLQMFAAKMFEQRILAAYREKVTRDQQEMLLAEEEERLAKTKQRKEKRKEDERKKKLQAEQEEQERIKREKQEEEARQKKKEEDERLAKEREARRVEDLRKAEEARLAAEAKKRAEQDRKREAKEKARLAEEQKRLEKERLQKERQEKERKAVLEKQKQKQAELEAAQAKQAAAAAAAAEAAVNAKAHPEATTTAPASGKKKGAKANTAINIPLEPPKEPPSAVKPTKQAPVAPAATPKTTAMPATTSSTAAPAKAVAASSSAKTTPAAPAKAKAPLPHPIPGVAVAKQNQNAKTTASQQPAKTWTDPKAPGAKNPASAGPVGAQAHSTPRNGSASANNAPATRVNAPKMPSPLPPTTATTDINFAPLLSSQDLASPVQSKLWESVASDISLGYAQTGSANDSYAALTESTDANSFPGALWGSYDPLLQKLLEPDPPMASINNTSSASTSSPDTTGLRGLISTEDEVVQGHTSPPTTSQLFAPSSTTAPHAPNSHLPPSISSFSPLPTYENPLPGVTDVLESSLKNPLLSFPLTGSQLPSGQSTLFPNPTHPSGTSPLPVSGLDDPAWNSFLPPGIYEPWSDFGNVDGNASGAFTAPFASQFGQHTQPMHNSLPQQPMTAPLPFMTSFQSLLTQPQPGPNPNPLASSQGGFYSLFPQ